MKEWHPFPKQEQALLATEFEVLFGGARGPGKTDAGMVWLLGEEYEKGKLYINHPRYRALILRKNSDDLNDWLDRASYMYKRYGANVVGKPARVEFPSGAIFRTGHLKDRKSYEKYLGHEYQRVLIEELTQIPKEIYYLQIMGSCRSTIPELVPQMFNTTNPGGVGHAWVKERFVDVAEWGKPYIYEVEVEGKMLKRSRVFISATLDDNPILKEVDPNYVVYLESLKDKDPELYKAWRHGDWDVFAGQFFKEFRRSLHLCNPFTPSNKLEHRGGIDWGYNASFVFLSGVIQKVEGIDSRNNKYSFNRVWIFREIDGTEKTPEEWAKVILGSKLPFDSYTQINCDPAMFHRKDDGSKSIVDQIKGDKIGSRGFVTFEKLLQPANNDRVGGWTMVHNWLSIAPDGLPYMLITENCYNLIRTLPNLVHDENTVEDIDTDGEDHWADALRYMLVHIKWIDADLGGTGHSSLDRNIKYKKAIVHEIDLDAFAQISKKDNRDWRSI